MALVGIDKNTRILAEKIEGPSEIISASEPVINVNIPTTIADTNDGNFKSTLFGSTINKNKTFIIVGPNTFTLETPLGTYILTSADSPITLTFDASKGTWIANPASPIFPSAPLFQKGEKFTGSGATGIAWQGSTISMSDDGSTLAVGGPYDGKIRDPALPIFRVRQGATWVFTKDSNGKWIQQGKKLFGSVVSSQSFPAQGTSVSLSSDGNTLATGGPQAQDSNGTIILGAVWIFTRSDGVWSEEAVLRPKTFVSTFGVNFGTSVSLNGAGNILAAGGPFDDNLIGSVWIFKKDKTWKETTRIVGEFAGQAKFGESVSLDLSGETLVVGAPRHNSDLGAVYIYRRNNSEQWIKEALITNVQGSTKIQIGLTTAISGDGQIVAAGTSGLGQTNNIVWIIKKNNGVWSANTYVSDPNNLFNGFVSGLSMNREGTLLAISKRFVLTTRSKAYLADLSKNVTPIPLLNQEILRPDGSDNQGYTVELKNNTLFVGDPTANDSIGLVNEWNISINNDVPYALFNSSIYGTDFYSSARQGKSVAMSKDGLYMAIGGTLDRSEKGSVWVFKRQGQTWKQMGAKIIPAGAIYQDSNTSPTENGGGTSLAMDASGKTLAIGVGDIGSNKGSIDIHVRNSDTDQWEPQSTFVNAPSQTNTDNFAASLAMSADGNTLVIGASNRDETNTSQGAIWIYVRSGTTWSFEAGPLEGSGGTANAFMGSSVAISYDGNTVAAGGPGDESNRGSVWIFVRSGTTWSQQGTKLSADASISKQGTSVALSSDGNRLAIGAINHGSTGAIWIFLRTGTTWVLETTTALTISEAVNLGTNVAMNGNGDIIIATDNSKDACWVFKRNPTTNAWGQYGDKVTSSNLTNKSGFGTGLALSGLGNIAIIGANTDTFEQGAILMFG